MKTVEEVRNASKETDNKAQEDKRRYEEDCQKKGKRLADGLTERMYRKKQSTIAFENRRWLTRRRKYNPRVVYAAKERLKELGYEVTEMQNGFFVSVHSANKN